MFPSTIVVSGKAVQQRSAPGTGGAQPNKPRGRKKDLKAVKSHVDVAGILKRWASIRSIRRLVRQLGGPWTRRQRHHYRQTPPRGRRLAQVRSATVRTTKRSCAAAWSRRAWRLVPAPRRGEAIRLLGEACATKEESGAMVTLENAGRAEVEKFRDDRDRRLRRPVAHALGLTMHSDRPPAPHV